MAASYQYRDIKSRKLSLYNMLYTITTAFVKASTFADEEENNVLDFMRKTR